MHLINIWKYESKNWTEIIMEFLKRYSKQMESDLWKNKVIIFIKTDVLFLGQFISVGFSNVKTYGIDWLR